jgi:hypothetical protein
MHEQPNCDHRIPIDVDNGSKGGKTQVIFLTEITQPCVHMCNGLFIFQLYLLPDLLEETDCKEDIPLMLPFCIICFPLTVDNSDMN